MEFTPYAAVVLAIAFVWSGFVRAGIGFGGAGLMYPVALIAVDSVLFLVPIICFQLLFFTTLTLVQDHGKINWPVAIKLFFILLPTLLIGIFGLVHLPELTILLILYAVLIFYSISYILDIRIAGTSRWIEFPSLMLGGYVSGMSLAGAPIVAAVAMRHLEKDETRATLFVLWIALVLVKLPTLYAFNVDLQIEQQLWALPCACLGHWMGNRLHNRLLELDSRIFYRWMGLALLGLSVVGLSRHLVGATLT